MGSIRTWRYGVLSSCVRLLCGMLLKSSSAEEPPNVYWHSTHGRQTHRVYQLLDTQQQALVDFLLAEPEQAPPSPCPLPILSSRYNRVRMSAPIAILGHQIYRDEWERKPITLEELRELDRRPRQELDYPEARNEIFMISKQLGIPFPGCEHRLQSKREN